MSFALAVFSSFSQFGLFVVSFYLLMNLAENTKVEDKMRKRNLVGHLVTSLERTTPELLVLVASFLLKLSVYRENKDEMVTQTNVYGLFATISVLCATCLTS